MNPPNKQKGIFVLHKTKTPISMQRQQCNSKKKDPPPICQKSFVHPTSGLN